MRRDLKQSEAQLGAASQLSSRLQATTERDEREPAEDRLGCLHAAREDLARRLEVAIEDVLREEGPRRRRRVRGAARVARERREPLPAQALSGVAELLGE